jgi:hypothetical protein
VPNQASDSEVGLRISEADRLLLERTLVSDDPETIPGLVEVLPPGAKPTIRAKYDLTAPGRPKVHCAHCHASRHYRGFVVDLGPGEAALIGINCGQEAFGFDWGSVVERFEADQDRQLDLRRLGLVAPLLLAFVQELEAIDASRVTHAYPAFMHALRETGKPGQLFGKAVREDGKMNVRQSRRDAAAELANARKIVPHLFEQLEDPTATPGLRKGARFSIDKWIDTYGEIWINEDIVVGRLTELQLFRQDTNIGGLKRSLESARRAAAALEQDTGAHTDLSRVMRDIQAAVEGANEAMDVLYALDRFVDPANLTVVAEWLNADGSCAFQLEERRLYNRYQSKGFGVPSGWRPPEAPVLKRMLGALQSSASA